MERKLTIIIPIMQQPLGGAIDFLLTNIDNYLDLKELIYKFQ